MRTNNNSGSWRKYLYSGVGHVAHAGDVIRKSSKEFSKHGKTMEADGHKIVNNAIEGIERKYNELVHKLAAFTNSEASHFQVAVNKIERQMVVKTKRGLH